MSKKAVYVSLFALCMSLANTQITYAQVIEIDLNNTSCNNFSTKNACINRNIRAIEEAGGGVVNLTLDDPNVSTTSVMTIGAPILLKNNVILNIQAGVTLEMDINVSNKLAVINLSNTSNSGVRGSGKINANGNATYAIYAKGVNNLSLGNTDIEGQLPHSPDWNPLTIEGWKYGVNIESYLTQSSEDITLQNLAVIKPNPTEIIINRVDDDGNNIASGIGVEYPVWIQSDTGQGTVHWVRGLAINGLLLDGGHHDDTVQRGAHCTEDATNSQADSYCNANGVNRGDGADRKFTADQLSIHGVHGKPTTDSFGNRYDTLTNILSINGGEVGVTVARGSKDLNLINVTAEAADAHGFNIGSSNFPIVVEDSSIFSNLTRVGLMNGARATISDVNAGVIWLRAATGDWSNANETLYNLTDDTINDMSGSQINDNHRTRNITLCDVKGQGNGLNAKRQSFANGNLLWLYDFFVQQSENVNLLSALSKSASEDTYKALSVTHSTYSADLLNQDSPEIAFQGIRQNGTASNSGGYTFPETFIFPEIFSYKNLRPENETGYMIVDMEDSAINTNVAVMKPVPPCYQNIEGSTSNDSLRGNHRDNIIRGLTGNDNIYGRAGDDQLFGHAGNDLLDGREGSDILTGGLGDDRLFGGDDADTLEGNGGDDILNGGDGVDILYGHGGNDLLNGGAGSDTLDGGPGTDTVSYENVLANQILIVDFAYPDRNTEEAVGDKFIDIENIIGSENQDSLRGDDGANIINGLSGNDFLHGRGGNDNLLGGDGADTFVFYPNWGNDEIMDYSSEDTLTFISFPENPACTDQMDSDGAPYAMYEDSGNTVIIRGLACTDIDDEY